MNENRFLAGKKIIVAEDDENSFFLLEFILREYNAKIIHTLSGADTIHAIYENPDVCLILMDIRMPGLNGLETTQRIREFNADVPIIAQTAMVFKDEKELILKAGCNDFILKPIDQHLLVSKMQQAIKFNSFKNNNVEN